MKNELKWSEHPFKNYSVTEIQDMIHAGIIPSGLAFFKTRDEFERAMDKAAGKLLKFVIFDPATNDMQIFETYIDEFSKSNMGCRIIFNEHRYKPIGLPSDFDEIQRFKKYLEGHYLYALADSQIFISVLNPTSLGTELLDLRSHLFLLAENFEKRETPMIPMIPMPSETPEEFELPEDAENPSEKRFFLVNQTLYSHLDYLDQTSSEVVAIQNEMTGQIELRDIWFLDSAVAISPETIQAIKNLKSF